MRAAVGYKLRMRREDAPCGRCGRTDWADATDQQYKATTDRLRAATGEAGYRAPDRVQVCQTCGTTVLVLSQTFGVPPPHEAEDLKHDGA